MSRKNEKAELKLIEPSLQDQLEAAIATASAAESKWRKAEAAFTKRFPDPRMALSDVAGTEPVDFGRSARDPEAPQSRGEKVAEEQRAVLALRDAATQARRDVDNLRTRIETEVSEKELRDRLAAVFDEMSEIGHELTRAGDAARQTREMVERARNGVAAAEAQLAEASSVVDRVLGAGLSEFLHMDESASTTEANSEIKAARDKKLQAADELELARSALSLAESRLALDDAKKSGAAAELRELDAQTVKLAGSIAATAIPLLLEEAKAMQLELEGRRNVLIALSKYDESKAWHGQIWDYLGAQVFPYGLRGEKVENHPAMARWLEFIAAVSNDTDVPLPIGTHSDG